MRIGDTSLGAAQPALTLGKEVVLAIMPNAQAADQPHACGAGRVPFGACTCLRRGIACRRTIGRRLYELHGIPLPPGGEGKGGKEGRGRGAPRMFMTRFRFLATGSGVSMPSRCLYPLPYACRARRAPSLRRDLLCSAALSAVAAGHDRNLPNSRKNSVDPADSDRQRRSARLRIFSSTLPRENSQRGLPEGSKMHG